MECTEFCILDTAVRVQNRLKGSLFYLLDSIFSFIFTNILLHGSFIYLFAQIVSFLQRYDCTL
uniref:Putative ovule protein n=1 Tax=Solanum chacoense TaxID=4108 RepID=A0A0V0HWN9_SOLCH